MSALLSFFLIMATHPDIQQRAQAEVDAVTSGILPRCSDRKDMPHLEAVLKEVHRINPVAPLCSSPRLLALDIWLSSDKF